MTCAASNSVIGPPVTRRAGAGGGPPGVVVEREAPGRRLRQVRARASCQVVVTTAPSWSSMSVSLPPARSRRPLVIAAVVAVVLALAAGAGAFVLLRQDPPEDTARAWLAAWQRGDYAGMQALLATPRTDLATVYGQATKGLGATSSAYTLGAIQETGDTATASFTAVQQLRGAGEWRYGGRLELVKAGRQWRVAWTPGAIHPELRDGMRLGTERVWPQRAPILAADGTVLVGTSEVVVIGVQPGRVKDRAALLKALERDAGADPAAVAKQLDDPKVKPDWFLPVAELSKAEYEKVRA